MNWLSCIGLPDMTALYQWLRGVRSEQHYQSDDETFIKMLVYDVNHAHQTIHIVEGEENIALYNDERVVDAFEKAVERGVKIQFVLKPAANQVVDE